MANNYTQASLAIKLHDAAETDWFREQIQLLDDAEDPGFAWEIEELESDGEPAQFFCAHHDETIDIDIVAGLLQGFITKFRPEETIGFTWADYCDKPHANEFGGGACLVHATGYEILTTGQALALLRAGLDPVSYLAENPPE